MGHGGMLRLWCCVAGRRMRVSSMRCGLMSLGRWVMMVLTRILRSAFQRWTAGVCRGMMLAAMRGMKGWMKKRVMKPAL